MNREVKSSGNMQNFEDDKRIEKLLKKSKNNMGSITGRLKVTQIGSAISKKYDQRQTLIGLGFKRMHQVVILDNTPSILGMIKKIQHLLKVEVVNISSKGND